MNNEVLKIYKDIIYADKVFDVNFKNVSKILFKEIERLNNIIKEAFLSFNVKDNKTFPYIFINDFEIISETNPEHKEIQEMTNDEHYKTKSDTFEQVEITDEDLPF